MAKFRCLSGSLKSPLRMPIVATVVLFVLLCRIFVPDLVVRLITAPMERPYSAA
jgi:hypothetical protein